MNEDIGAGIIDDFGGGKPPLFHFIYKRNQLIKDPIITPMQIIIKKNLLIGSFIDILL